MIRFLDCCLLDYFGGYHKPVIAIPVTNKTTYKELKEDILSEYNATWDYLTYADEHYVHPWPEHSKAVAESIDKDWLPENNARDQPAFPGLEDTPEGEDDNYNDNYAYFTWEE